MAGRAGGHLFARGWHVGYVWGVEEGEEYLEVLAQHRMTDDDRFRILASGRIQGLPAPGGVWSYRTGATEAEIDAARRKHAERNRRIYADLRDRGLLPPQGGNLPAHEINEYLRSGNDVSADDD